MTPTTTDPTIAPDAGVRPKILEAADCSFGGPEGADLALTCEWPDGSETLEHVSEHAARLLGYDPDENGDPRDDAQCPACNGTGRGQGDSDRCGFCGGDGSVPLDAAVRFSAKAEAIAPDAGVRETASSECITPGVCSCPNMPRCPKCGYTAHDAAHLMDHHRPYCDGTIPSAALARATQQGADDAGRSGGDA